MIGALAMHSITKVVGFLASSVYNSLIILSLLQIPRTYPGRAGFAIKGEVLSLAFFRLFERSPPLLSQAVSRVVIPRPVSQDETQGGREAFTAKAQLAGTSQHDLTILRFEHYISGVWFRVIRHASIIHHVYLFVNRCIIINIIRMWKSCRNI